MMELEADEEGRIARLLVPEGTDDVAVGTVIAVMSSEDEAADGPAAPEPQPLNRPKPAPETVAECAAPAPVMTRHAAPPPTPGPVPVLAPEPLSHRIKVRPTAARHAADQATNPDRREQ